MEAKIMKMAKKLLAVVLTGVMAVSMLTGCATLDARNIASDLEGMLKVVSIRLPSLLPTMQRSWLSRPLRLFRLTPLSGSLLLIIALRLRRTPWKRLSRRV